MTDREARDIARSEKRNTPSPRKKTQKKIVNDEDKENGEKRSPRGKKSLFSDEDPLQLLHSEGKAFYPWFGRTIL